MGKNNYIKKTLICLMVLTIFFFSSCISNMPSKKSNMELGKEVRAPRGYIDWKER